MHFHDVTSAVPKVKIAHNTDLNCIRCPDCKLYTLYTSYFLFVCTEHLINLIVDALGKQFQILFRKCRKERIGILLLPHRTIRIIDLIGIAKNLILIYQYTKKACVIQTLHLVCSFTLLFLYHNAGCLRIKATNAQTILCQLRSEYFKRVLCVRIHNSLDFFPIHVFL